MHLLNYHLYHGKNRLSFISSNYANEIIFWFCLEMWNQLLKIIYLFSACKQFEQLHLDNARYQE
jgi:hypothetical protein